MCVIRVVIIEKQWLVIKIKIDVEYVCVLRFFYKKLTHEKFILKFINGYKIYVNKLELSFKLRFDIT